MLGTHALTLDILHLLLLPLFTASEDSLMGLIALALANIVDGYAYWLGHIGMILIVLLMNNKLFSFTNLLWAAYLKQSKLRLFNNSHFKLQNIIVNPTICNYLTTLYIKLVKYCN